MEKEEELIYKKHIGKKIKVARLKAGYTQEQLAEKLSLSPRYISQLERGISFGTATTIINICKTLNISADFLFSDLINSNNLSSVFDVNFSKNYMNLDRKNQALIHAITSTLVRFQNQSQNGIF